MKYLLILPLLLASTIASADSISATERAWQGKAAKPESFDQSLMMGPAKKMKFEQAIVPIATAEQFEIAMQAVRQEMAKRGAREGAEASADGTQWFVMDHSPNGYDELENYDVREILKTHNRDYSTFAVRTRMNAYNKDGGWAWHSGKPRYVVYVRNDGKVLGVKEDNFSNVIEAVDASYAATEPKREFERKTIAQIAKGVFERDQRRKDQQAEAVRASAMKASGYSREADEAEEVSSSSAE